MLARIAHDLFWLGRNLARGEHTARMLEGVSQADLQSPIDDPSAVFLSWDGVLAIMGAPALEHQATREEVLRALTTDATNDASVRACVVRAREGARVVRDVISAEMWTAINRLYLEIEAGDYAGPYGFTQRVKERTALFWGATGATMLRDEAAAFLQAGRRLEAADMVLRMLRVALPFGREEDGATDGQALALLQAVGGFQAFRRAVPAPPNAGPVARFLLFERAYPDSVAASVESARAALAAADHNERVSEPVLRLSRVAADLEFRARDGEDQDLREVFALVGRELQSLDRDIATRYFAGALT